MASRTFFYSLLFFSTYSCCSSLQLCLQKDIIWFNGGLQDALLMPRFLYGGWAAKWLTFRESNSLRLIVVFDTATDLLAADCFVLVHVSLLSTCLGCGSNSRTWLLTILVIFLSFVTSVFTECKSSLSLSWLEISFYFFPFTN